MCLQEQHRRIHRQIFISLRGGKEKFSDCPGKPFGYIPSVFAGSEALDKVQEEVPHLRRRASHDPSSAEPLEVTFASDLNRGPHTGSFNCALSSSEDEKEESFPGEDVTSSRSRV